MGLDKIFKFLVPKDKIFFPLFKKDAENLIKIAESMVLLVKDENPEKREEIIKQIKELEKNGDNITHEIFEKLNVAFITPFDREDIHELASTIDDVADAINKAAHRIKLYKPKKFLPEFLKITELIHEGTIQINIAINEMEAMDNFDKVTAACIKINEIENKNDELYHHALSQLFEIEKDIAELIKNKEILETLEKATDKSEDVSDVIKTIIIKVT